MKTNFRVSSTIFLACERSVQEENLEPFNTYQSRALLPMHTSNLQVSEAVEHAESQLGPVDVSICCAGFASTGK